jgi:hypothetical protein
MTAFWVVAGVVWFVACLVGIRWAAIQLGVWQLLSRLYWVVIWLLLCLVLDFGVVRILGGGVAVWLLCALLNGVGLVAFERQVGA